MTIWKKPITFDPNLRSNAMSHKLCTLSETQEIAGDYFDKINDVVKRAFAISIIMRTTAASHIANPRLSQSSIYGTIHGLIVSILTNEYSDDPNVVLIDKRKIFAMIIRDKILFRFKKMDSKRKTSNHFSKSNERFNNQDHDGFDEKLTFVFVGYVPDRSNSNLNNIWLQVKKGKEVLWYHNLFESGEQLTWPLPDSIPVQPSSPQRTNIKIKDDKSRTGTNDI